MWWIVIINVYLQTLVWEANGAFLTTLLIRKAYLEKADHDKVELRKLFNTFKDIRRDYKEKQNSPDQCLEDVMKNKDNFARYQQLRNLQNKNEELFFSCLIKHINELLPIVYSPGVGEVCQKYNQVSGPKRGLTLLVSEGEKMEEKLREWKKQYPDIKAIVVTDGGKIEGEDDLGANGMGIAVGKMAIYSALGGIHPKHCLPVTLDVGTNNKDLREGKTYVGMNLKRVEGAIYESFVETFMTGVRNVFGPSTLVQFEDFASENSFKFLKKYREHYTMFIDDIQGTAAVAVAGLLAADRFSTKKLGDFTVLFAGEHDVGVVIASLIVEAMKDVGILEDDARKKIYFMGCSGLITSVGDYFDDDERNAYRKTPDEIPNGANTEDLLEIIKWLRPNVLIGVSNQGGLFTEEVLREMALHNKEPIIFPLSSPADNSECTATQAYQHAKVELSVVTHTSTGVRKEFCRLPRKVLFASGSTFEPVEMDGRLHKPKPCSNVYIFPGVALAATSTQMTKVPDKAFLIAAQTLANKCTLQEDYDEGSLFPRLERMRDCSIDIAADVAKYALKEGLSSLEKLPDENDVRKFIRCQQYTPKVQKSDSSSFNIC